MDAVSLLPESLTTPRLVVRRARSSDAAALADAISETLGDLSPWFKWAELLQRWGTPGDLGQRAINAERRHALGLDPTYYLWSRHRPDHLLGEICLKTEGWRFGVFTYSVWVRRSAMGQGHAREGSQVLFDAAFRQASADYVEAQCAFGNHRSRRLLTRLGFCPWGATRDLQRYLLEPATRFKKASTNP